MIDFLTALGLMLVLEGALYALFPEGMRKLAAQMIVMPPATLRIIGLSFAIFGVLIIGVLRGF